MNGDPSSGVIFVTKLAVAARPYQALLALGLTLHFRPDLPRVAHPREKQGLHDALQACHSRRDPGGRHLKTAQ
jgi:hypothetical protein